MTRLLSLAAFGILVAVLFSLPEPNAERLAALQIGELLALEVEGAADADSSDPEGTELWRALLASPAAEPSADGATILRLGEARIESTGEGLAAEPASETTDQASRVELRRSIARALRAIEASHPDELSRLEIEGLTQAAGGGADVELTLAPGELQLAVTPPGAAPLLTRTPWRPAGRRSLAPPFLAILVAILFRRPVLALASGVLAGTFLLRQGGSAEVFEALGLGFVDAFAVYLKSELVDRDRQYIIAFVMFMLAMVGVMTRAGGIRGLMDKISAFAYDVRRTQLATWLMGLVVFFDDYANTILVGSTMRPLTDRFKIAREKLAYIVDSTAAPVAGLSIFSTWIAFEVSTFSAQLPDVGLAASDGYGVFLRTLPYRFYCVFTLAFVGMIVISGRDFGPMLAAERRARGGKVLADGARPMVGKAATELSAAPGVTPSAPRALVPLLMFLGITLFEIFRTGGAFELGAGLWTLEGLAGVLSDGNPLRALAVGSLAGLLSAALLAALAGVANEVPRAAWAAIRSMLVAVVILYLAWMIGAICGDLGTAPYLTVLLSGAIDPLILPCVLFLLSGIVAFSTGSSWSTMSILLPIVVGMAFALGEGTELGGSLLMVISIGAVLEGAIFGDHCSPISDTTVMSSIASASDHIDHVRTQAPYAVLTMGVAMLAGYVPATFFGLSPWIGLIAGVVILALCVRFLGRQAEAAPAG